MMKKLLTTVLALVMALSLAACGTPGQAESPSNPPSPDVTASPSQTPELFTFTRENFPRLNGSTSTAPLGRALAAVLLGESADDVADLINFSRTTAVTPGPRPSPGPIRQASQFSSRGAISGQASAASRPSVSAGSGNSTSP